MKVKFYLICLFILLIYDIPLSAFGQKSGDSTMIRYEDTLKCLFHDAFLRDSIRFLKSDKEKLDLNNRILKVFHNALEEKNSFSYRFDSVKNISILVSNDKLVRIITWNLKFHDQEYKFYGFIQYYLQKKNTYLLYDLTDNTKNIIDPENATLNNSNWFGSIYYEILDGNIQGETVYTLLGWKGNNIQTNKKVIETLYFAGSGNIIFGKPILKSKTKARKRIVFEYSIKSTMLLKYNEFVKMIVFDHLAPSDKSLTGMYQFYGADGTYDGFMFEDGAWFFYSDLNYLPDKNLIIGNPTKRTIRDN